MKVYALNAISVTKSTKLQNNCKNMRQVTMKEIWSNVKSVNSSHVHKRKWKSTQKNSTAWIISVYFVKKNIRAPRAYLTIGKISIAKPKLFAKNVILRQTQQRALDDMLTDITPSINVTSVTTSVQPWTAWKFTKVINTKVKDSNVISATTKLHKKEICQFTDNQCTMELYTTVTSVIINQVQQEVCYGIRRLNIQIIFRPKWQIVSFKSGNIIFTQSYMQENDVRRAPVRLVKLSWNLKFEEPCIHVCVAFVRCKSCKSVACLCSLKTDSHWCANGAALPM